MVLGRSLVLSFNDSAIETDCFKHKPSVESTVFSRVLSRLSNTLHDAKPIKKNATGIRYLNLFIIPTLLYGNFHHNFFHIRRNSGSNTWLVQIGRKKDGKGARSERKKCNLFAIKYNVFFRIVRYRWSLPGQSCEPNFLFARYNKLYVDVLFVSFEFTIGGRFSCIFANCGKKQIIVQNDFPWFDFRKVGFGN